MAKVAAPGPGPLPSNSLHFGSGGGGVASKATTAVKRKTPSELRGEQLKRKNIVELVDESSVPVLGSAWNANGAASGLKKSDLSKNPRYIDTRMDELFPVRKNSTRFRLLSRKENAKENILVDHSATIRNSSTPSDLTAESQPQISCPQESLKDRTSKQAYSTTEKCCESTFRSVTELSLGGEKFSGLSTVDMDKALKGLVACEPPLVSASAKEDSARTGDCTLQNFCSEFHIPCQKIPLDFTLKSTMWVVSSSSVNWFHRLINCGTFNVMAQHKSGTDYFGDQISTQLSNPKTLHSWVYPQSSLPPSVISALTLSGQADFLSKRQSAWEDAFRSLYYMLRKKVCNLFYVCTQQFVVMFTGCDDLKEAKCACNAYISQSTRGLRSLLKEHGVCFSMPLCHSKVEQVTAEDLVELSEIEKHNLGQTRRLGSVYEVDNSPQSLLVFSGNTNVHGLYDFLLNYRFILNSLTGMDVPVLYSPVPFESASLSAPEVRCKEVKRADHMSFPVKEPSKMAETNKGSLSSVCYSIEIKDAYLPPWIISTVCDAMGSQGSSFEASFVTEPMSIGLNVGLDDVVCQEADDDAKVDERSRRICVFGVPDAIYSPHLRSASLKGLKYCNGSYTASLSRL
ncbi:hypothetical protein LguiA_024411 [Lonicera macranthoides]